MLAPERPIFSCFLGQEDLVDDMDHSVGCLDVS